MIEGRDDANRIQPGAKRPTYWQYRGRPTLLLGGSVEDNLFQIPDLAAHLDLLRSVGGNYVRCTMSSRDEGNAWPFARREDGLYDLEQPDDGYWRRLAEFLELTAERDVIVQIELWATFDYYRENWAGSPWNPANNVNYSAEQTGLPLDVPTHPVKTENDFFRSAPAELDRPIVLAHQQAFVDRICSHSLTCGHVLYCMDNETSVSGHWGAYWSARVKARAAEAGVNVETTEMWDPHDLNHEMHARTFDHPETYSFVDVSQNNHQTGQAHYDRLMEARRRILTSGHPRPMNNVKVYGADTGGHGTGENGRRRFWRTIFAGCASARFHRPPSGHGLGETAQAHLRAARMLTDAVGVVESEPANDLLARRDENEAYCLAHPAGRWAVFFPNGGDVDLDASAAADRPLTVRWLDIAKSEWSDPVEAVSGPALRLQPLAAGYWVALVEAAR